MISEGIEKRPPQTEDEYYPWYHLNLPPKRPQNAVTGVPSISYFASAATSRPGSNMLLRKVFQLWFSHRLAPPADSLRDFTAAYFFPSLQFHDGATLTLLISKVNPFFFLSFITCHKNSFFLLSITEKILTFIGSP